jgi:outer membrane protein TolC
MTARTYLASLLLTSVAIAPASAQPDREEKEDSDGPEADAAAIFALERLIQISVQQAPDFSRAKLEREAAQGAAGAANADQQWQLRLGGEYKRNYKGYEADVGLFQPVDTSSLSTALSLGRNLPTGGRVDVEASAGQVSNEILIPSDASFEGLMAKQNGQELDEFSTVIQTAARLTLKQPLVRGFGPDVALITKRRAELQFAISTIDAQNKAEEMIRDIVNLYWELAFANYQVDTRNRAVELAAQQEKTTRDELRAGKSPQSALNAVLYETHIRKEALIAAQLDLEKKSMELRRKTGLGLDRRNFILRPGDKFEIGEDEFDIDETLARSRKANRKMASIALQKKLADAELKVAKNGILPQVDATLMGALLGTGDNTGESFGALTGFEGFEVSAGLQVQFDLGGAAKANYESALAKRRRVDVDREDLERQIDAEVIAAVKQVTFARTRVSLSEKAITIADSNWKSEQLKFQAGQTSNFSVMQRQTELIDAQLKRGRAVADYHISVATLQYLSGTILEQYRVNVRPKAAREQGGGTRSTER